MIHITPQQLRKAADIQEKIQSLQKELNQILGATAEPTTTRAPKAKRGRKKMTPAEKAKMSALMKARWAKAKRAGKAKL